MIIIVLQSRFKDVAMESSINPGGAPHLLAPTWTARVVQEAEHDRNCLRADRIARTIGKCTFIPDTTPFPQSRRSTRRRVPGVMFHETYIYDEPLNNFYCTTMFIKIQFSPIDLFSLPWIYFGWRWPADPLVGQGAWVMFHEAHFTMSVWRIWWYQRTRLQQKKDETDFGRCISSLPDLQAEWRLAHRISHGGCGRCRTGQEVRKDACPGWSFISWP